MRVQGKWDDDYYDGVVVSIDYQNRTVHIKYDDDDADDAVPWDDTRILDEFPLFGWPVHDWHVHTCFYWATTYT